MNEKIANYEERINKLCRIATDRKYMMDAYRAMLGPVALKVVNVWDQNGVVRQHTSWGPDAANLTGEERAQILLDAESKIHHPLDFGDGTKKVEDK